MPRGGIRKGAGRKRSAPTVTLSFRIPETKAFECKVHLYDILEKSDFFRNDIEIFIINKKPFKNGR